MLIQIQNIAEKDFNFEAAYKLFIEAKKKRMKV